MTIGLVIIGLGIGALYWYQKNYKDKNNLLSMYNPISDANQSALAASFDKSGLLATFINDKWRKGEPSTQYGTPTLKTPEKVKFDAIRQWYDKSSLLANAKDRTVTGPDPRSFINPSVLGKVGTLHKMKYLV